MKKYFIKTFGCQMNYADSEKVNMVLLQSGFMKIANWTEADLIIFNTCSVRQKGEDRVFGMYEDIQKEKARLKKEGINGPKLLIGITGCMVRKTGMNKKYFNLDNKRDRNKAKKIALLNDEKGIFNNDDKLFPRLVHLDFVFRIEEVNFLTKILSSIYGNQIGSDDKFDDYLKTKQIRDNPSSASIIIQTGCDNYCTFCIVPYTRGKEISRPMKDIIEEAKQAVKLGAKEITLLGQNVNSYGKQFEKKLWNEEKSKWNNLEGKSPFGKLLDELDKIEGLDRVRFTSSNPHDMTADILESHFTNKSVCNYLHFALQSGSDEMLKRMNRKHKYDDFKKMVNYLRGKDPYFSISTDIIVGYSGETQDMFEATCKAMEELEFDFVYIARYSVRKGTIASKIYPDDVPDRVKAERWHILNNLLKKNVVKRNNAMIGKVEEILVGGEKEGDFFGRTRNFKEVYFKSNKNIKIGDFVKVKLTKVDGWVIRGEEI